MPILWQPKSERAANKERENTLYEEERQTEQFIKDKTRRRRDSPPDIPTRQNIAAFEQILGNHIVTKLSRVGERLSFFSAHAFLIFRRPQISKIPWKILRSRSGPPNASVVQFGSNIRQALCCHILIAFPPPSLPPSLSLSLFAVDTNSSSLTR